MASPASSTVQATDARAIYTAAIRAVDPVRLIASRLARDGKRLVIDLGACRAPLVVPLAHVWVAGAGKASEGFARGLQEVAPELEGTVIGPGRTRRIGELRFLPGDHPVPGERSFRSTRALLAGLAERARLDRVLLLLSGGASAMLAAPAPGITRADKVRLGELLLCCGAPIQEVNAIRKHVSRIKGGGLLRLAAPRPVVTLALSDVLGDDLATIGSGPSVADPSTFRRALTALRRHAPGDAVPERVLRRLERGACRMALADRPAETLKPGDPLLLRSCALVIGSNRIALAAAAEAAALRGYRVERRTQKLAGEASRAALEIAKSLPEQPERPTCVLAGGETVVSVGDAPGRGGRCQELALAAALALEGSGWTLLAAGTDGIDGRTPAAGAFCDGRTVARGGRKRARSALARHDSYPFLGELGDLLVTGPSGTNVMDLVIALHPGRQA